MGYLNGIEEHTEAGVWYLFSNIVIVIVVSLPPSASLRASLGDATGSVPDHCSKACIVIKGVTVDFFVPRAYKGYVYTML